MDLYLEVRTDLEVEVDAGYNIELINSNKDHCHDLSVLIRDRGTLMAQCNVRIINQVWREANR